MLLSLACSCACTREGVETVRALKAAKDEPGAKLSYKTLNGCLTARDRDRDASDTGRRVRLHHNTVALSKLGDESLQAGPFGDTASITYRVARQAIPATC